MPFFNDHYLLCFVFVAAGWMVKNSIHSIYLNSKLLFISTVVLLFCSSLFTNIHTHVSGVVVHCMDTSIHK